MRQVLLLSLAVSGTLSILSLLGPPYVYSDQALQLTSVQAWQQHEARWPNRLVSADPADLSRDLHAWNIWNPPGFPFLIAALTRAGLSLGAAVRLVSIACFMAGCAGWSLWALRFSLSSRLHLAVPLLIPGIRYGNDSLPHFHAEAFLFAATPWLLLFGFDLARRGIVAALCFGLTLGSIYLFKYSGLFIVLGLLLVAAREARGRIVPCAIAAAVPVLVLSALNRDWGGTENLVTASWHFQFAPKSLLYLAGTIPLTLADGGQIFEAMLLNPRYGVFLHPAIIPLLGLPGLAFLVFALGKKAAWRAEEKSTLLFVVANAGLMLLVWCLCTGVGYDRRYLAPASLALLPLALSVAGQEYRQPSAARRWIALAFLFAYIVTPAAYGYATFAAKLVSSSVYRATPSGLWDPILTDHDGAGVNVELNARLTDPAREIWYIPEPILALDLHGRKIFGHPTWSPGPLEETTYRTSRPLRILALAPRPLDAEAASYLARIFPQSSAWKSESIPQANYVLWSAELQP